MMIVTATNGRPEIAEVWCAAVTATLRTEHAALVLYNGSKPACNCKTQEYASITATVGLRLDSFSRGPVRMYLEEDMIPVCPWTVNDYPGRLVAAQGNEHGQPWPALLIKRDVGQPETAIVSQRFVRAGGCPDWLPPDLCEPALRANAKVLGEHFLHIDKMYRPGVREAADKNALLWLLRERYADAPPAPRAPPGLGDYVAAGLSAVGITPERVSAALGVKDCGCKKRQARLNELGRKIGIG